MDQEQFRELTQRYLAGTASEAEKAFLEAYYAAFENRPDILAKLSAAEQERLEEVLYQELWQQVPATRIRPLRRWRYIAAAAIAVLVLSAGAFFWRQYHSAPSPVLAVKQPLPDIPPGRTGAVLTLADGSQVPVDSAMNAVVATQNGMQVVASNGTLHYRPAAGNTAVAAYNTLTTPRGTQFHIQLPDGSGVWLNAASAIRYPTAFTGATRSVEVSGEAYFEVAPDSKRPFMVNVNNRQEITVLGTRFNVNAYEDEQSLTTTLLEGAVRLSASRPREAAVTVLHPGQQARLANRLKVVSNADTDAVMAWKNGYFNFNDKSLEEVLRLLTRWYDITVVTTGKLPEIHFGGEMERDLPLSDVLEFLEKSGVHFRIEPGRRLIVLP